jgi:hypothetical protein
VMASTRGWLNPPAWLRRAACAPSAGNRRRTYLLPPGAPTEVIDAQADLWSYACFTAVLLHDIGKPAVDQACGQAGSPWGEWQQELTLLRFPASRLWPDPAARPDTCHGTVRPLAGTDVSEAPETRPAAAQRSWRNHPIG